MAATLPTMLVYSRTAGYRHESIPTAKTVLAELASSSQAFVPTFSEDPSLFTPANLSQFDTIAFLSNSDEILDDYGKVALLSWLTAGNVSRGVLGFHSATAALFDTPYFGTCLGAFFDYHPYIQNLTIEVLDNSHPSTNSLPSSFSFYEEAYHFRSDPRDTNITGLLTYENNYTDPQNNTTPYNEGPAPVPIAWYREGGIQLNNDNVTGGESGFMPGRVWYTALGHESSTWESQLFKEHIMGGIKWVLEAVTNTSSTSTTSTGSTATSTAPSSSVAASAATNLLVPGSAVAVIATVLVIASAFTYF